MAEFKPVKGLDQLVARMVVNDVSNAAKHIESSAQRNAPSSKTWVSLLDGRERPEHRKAHNQAVPSNVRYQVKTPQYDMEHYDPNPYQLMRYPRDSDNATPGNVENCRCFEEFDPEGVARNIEASRAVQQGTKVTASVTAKFNRIEESEYGANGETGIRFMGRALTETAAEYKGR